jgi:ADP-heptose:LPS heptosyltransferase
LATDDLSFKNILVIHFGQLGDVVLGLPALCAIRDRFSGARITLLVGKSAAEVTALAAIADDQIVVDRVMLRDGNKVRSVGNILSLVGEVRRRKFDLVIDLHSLSETNLLGFLAGIKVRLYANRESRSLDSLGNFKPKPPREDKSKHAAERYLEVLRPLGINDSALSFTFQPHASDLDLVNARFFSESGERFVGLFPGAGHPSRCWNIDNFATLAARLADDGFRPVVLLGPEEARLKQTVVDTFPRNTIVVDGLTIPQFIAAASRLVVFVTNDTGPMHLAACAGVAIVLLLDERAPTAYLPLTERLAVVRNRTIDLISVDDVYAEAARLLGQNDKTSAA